MKKVLCFVMLLAIVSACKDSLGKDEKGFVSVNGEKVISIHSGSEADMEGIGLGKAYWNLFLNGQSNSEEAIATLRATIDPESGKLLPVSIFIRNIPGHENINIDGLKCTPDGRCSYQDYVITVTRFSTNETFTSLDADISIASHSELRIVYSGETPNDGVTYRLDL